MWLNSRGMGATECTVQPENSTSPNSGRNEAIVDTAKKRNKYKIDKLK